MGCDMIGVVWIKPSLIQVTGSIVIYSANNHLNVRAIVFVLFISKQNYVEKVKP